MQEGSINRPISAGGRESTTGKRSIGEKSFDVFQDDNDDGMDVSGTDILPKELTEPTQIGQWNIPPVEKHPPAPRSQPEEPLDAARDKSNLQITEPQPPSSVQSEEASDEELDAHDASGVLVQPTERRYYRPETRESSSDRLSEPDRVDYEYPERYADDEELSGEDYEEEEDLHRVGYYSQDRRTRREEEEYYDEEEYSEEEEEEEGEREVEEEEPAREKVPEVVDLTLDSSEEESEGEEDELVALHRALEPFEKEEEEEEEEEEEYEDEDEDQSSWTGIKSNTPFTDASHSTPQLGTLAYIFDRNSMLPPSNTAGLSNSFNFASNQPQSLFQPDVPSFPADLISQGLDPAIFQAQQSFHPVNDLSGPTTASLLDSVLSFPTDPSTLPSMAPPLRSTMISETLEFDATLSSVPPKPADFKGRWS